MVFLRAVPQPLGGVLWWGFFACQLAWGAARCWQRTRLAYAAAAMAVAAVTSAVMCALTIAGYPFPDLPRAGWILFAAGGLAPLILFQLEARLHPLEWRR
jgi:hypothetical protein